MDLKLRGKKAIITGSTKGIGKAIALSLASEGCQVVVTGRDKEQLETTVQEIKKASGTIAYPIRIDLQKEGSAEQLLQIGIEILGDIDILVNNAGIWPTSYVTDMSKDEFEKTMYLNLEVPYLLSKNAANYFLEEKKKGKIIHIVSQAAFHGSTTGHAHYAASKAGLVAFMISQAREVAKYGININAVAPGMVDTDMVRDNVLKNEEYYKNRIPVGRLARPEEIANIVTFLASEKADYLTGITIDATGGMLMR